MRCYDYLILFFVVVTFYLVADMEQTQKVMKNQVDFLIQQTH